MIQDVPLVKVKFELKQNKIESYYNINHVLFSLHNL
jgi:hypothetical protein